MLLIVACVKQVRKLAPRHLRGINARRTIHITCAMFSCSGEVVATYNDEARSCVLCLLCWSALLRSAQFHRVSISR